MRGKAYHNHRETSSSFLQKSLRFFRTPALTCTKCSVLEQKIIFALFCTFCTKRRKGSFFCKGKLIIEQNYPQKSSVAQGSPLRYGYNCLFYQILQCTAWLLKEKPEDEAVLYNPHLVRQAKCFRAYDCEILPSHVE